MTSFARFYNFHLNLYNVISDVTDRLKKSEIAYFSKQYCSRLPKYSIPTIQLNLQNKQEIQFHQKHGLQNSVAITTSGNSTTSLNCQINLRNSLMISKDYLKLSEIASHSKLARASKAPPPPPPRSNRVRARCTKPCGNRSVKILYNYFVGNFQIKL